MPEYLSCATWNLRVGRNPARVAREVDDLVRYHSLDVLTVCEAAAYIPAIRKALRGRYVVSTGRDASGRDSAVISRKGLRRGLTRVHRLESTGWERKAGRPGLHEPRSMVSRNIAGIKFAAVHIPPPAGPRQPLRVEAARNSLATVAELGRRWTDNGRRWVMAGDWNMRPGDPEVRVLKDETEGDVTGNHIDWVLSHGVRVSDYQRIDHGDIGGPGASDHAPVLFTVRKV